MTSSVFLILAVLASSPKLPWQDLVLSIERDHSTSSDMVTLCRVRVVNRGAQTWQGRAIRFEATALQGGVVVARERGRFGLTIGPHETLETIISFQGVFDRFEVRAVSRDAERGKSKSRGGKRAKGSGKKRKNS